MMPSAFQLFKKELRFSDILNIIKILFSSAVHAFAQGASFVILSGITWILSQTMLGQVIVPGGVKAIVGVAQVLLPAMLAPYAGSLLLGGFVAFWGISLLVWKIDNATGKKKSDKGNVGPEVQGTPWLSAAYFFGAWILPATLLYVGLSQGGAIKLGLTSMGCLSALVAGSINLIARTTEFVGQFLQRMGQRMLEEQSATPTEAEVELPNKAEVELPNKAEVELPNKAEVELPNEVKLNASKQVQAYVRPDPALPSSEDSYDEDEPTHHESSTNHQRLLFAQYMRRLLDEDISRMQRNTQSKEANFDDREKRTQHRH